MNWWNISISLIGGLALFLYGMSQMTTALKAVAGNRLKTLLARMTKNRWTSMTAGTVITAVIQSSSVTTVLVVGFVSAGLLAFPKTLGIILGANIGTTITAQIIAFKITDTALLIIAAGYLISVVSRSAKLRHLGGIFLGLGLVFLGMKLMTDASMPLRDYTPFIELMGQFSRPFWGILLGAVFTALVQSSSATTGVVIVMASQGLITLQAGIAIIIGANIGTCVTAMLAAINKPRAALKVALSHVTFKLIGAALWVAFIQQLAQGVSAITEADLGRQIAHAHSIFNISTALVLIGFTKPIAQMINWLVPDDTRKPNRQYLLDAYYLEHTGLALDMTKQAIHDMAGTLKEIADDSLPVLLSGTAQDLEQLRARDALIDTQHEKILSYMGQIQQKPLKTNDQQRVKRQTEIANILETAADMITADMVEAAEHRVKLGFEVSEVTRQRLTDLFHEAYQALYAAMDAVKNRSEAKAQQVKQSKSGFAVHHARVHEHLYARLAHVDTYRVDIIRFELELLEMARRLHSLARRLARRAGDT